jgi:hypothetical protein
LAAESVGDLRLDNFRGDAAHPEHYASIQLRVSSRSG